MAQGWAEKEQGGAQPRASGEKTLVLRLAGAEVEDGKALFAGDRAHHLVNENDARRPASKRRVVAGEHEAQAIAYHGKIAKGDRLLAMVQKIAPHRVALGMLAELRA